MQDLDLLIWMDPTQHYTCYPTDTPITVDGMLKEPFWQHCPRSPRFGDIVDGKPGWYNTEAALAWDAQYLYVAFWVEEPYLAAQFTQRDARVYLENDIEVFIAGDACYYEFQMNARGTIYEVFYIPQSEYYRGKFHQNPLFQFEGQRVDVLGGFQDESRYSDTTLTAKWAFRDYDFADLQTAVDLQGTLNDHSDVDKGWTVEIAFPWQGMKDLFPNRQFPPKDGESLRMDFSRFELVYVNGHEVTPHPGWTWSPHGVYDSHLPGKFTTIHFSEQTVQK